MTQKNVGMLRVSSRSGNFRRAGYSFGTEPQDLPLAALSEAACAAIIAEPMLVAVEVEGPITRMQPALLPHAAAEVEEVTRGHDEPAPTVPAAGVALASVQAPAAAKATVKATSKKSAAKPKV